MNSSVVVLYAVMALGLRVGHLFLLAGSVRSKNAASVAARLVIELGIVLLGYWAVGAAVMLYVGDSTFGFESSFLFSFESAPVRWLTALPLLLITGPAVIGASAERVKLSAVIGVTAMLAIVVAPLLANWATIGWLYRHGLIDGGPATISVMAGAAAAVTAWFVGPRKNKFNRDGSVNNLPAHQLPMTLVGALVGFIGWTLVVALGFVTSPLLPVVVCNVLLGGAAATLTGLLFARLRFGRPDVGLALAAGAGGLVAASAGAAALSSWQVVVTCALAGVLCPASVIASERRFKLDDVTSAAAVHWVGGGVGLLLAAVFLPSNWYDRGAALFTQTLAFLVATLLGGGATIVTLLICSRFGGVRLSESEEYDGADLAELDLNAYPDFQQTMIKSYHAREL